MTPATVLGCAAWEWGQRGAPSGPMALACLGGMVLAALVWRRGGPERRFWGWAALILGALAVNRALDLQGAVTAAGRCLWQLQGWYGARGPWQAGLAAGLGLAGLGLGVGLTRRLPGRLWAALWGLLGLGLLTGLRLAGLHGLDGMLARHGPGLELAALALVAATAAIALHGRKGYPPPPDPG